MGVNGGLEYARIQGDLENIIELHEFEEEEEEG
ncbi:hypothetical protein [Bacillus thuringiensis]